MLESAYENGASLLKFGGDALLLWFEEEVYAARAARAAVRMREVLHEVGRIELMSQGCTRASPISSLSAARIENC